MATAVSRGGKALVSDDDEFFRVALSSILRNRLHLGEVLETSSFDEALECLTNTESVTLSLFDLAMPGMENPGSLRAVREGFPETRVAVVSSSSRREDILKALDAGVHGYVPKGLGVTELGNALETIVEGMVYVPPSLAEIGPDSDLSFQAMGETTAGTPDGLPPLTPRQREVLELIVGGKSNKEIARALSLGEGTVKVHLAALFRNLGVSNRAAAAAVGARFFQK